MNYHMMNYHMSLTYYHNIFSLGPFRQLLTGRGSRYGQRPAIISGFRSSADSSICRECSWGTGCWSDNGATPRAGWFMENPKNGWCIMVPPWLRKPRECENGWKMDGHGWTWTTKLRPLSRNDFLSPWIYPKMGPIFSIEPPEDSVEISGFSGFIVGLAFLPYTFYALLTAFNVVRLSRAEKAGKKLGKYGQTQIDKAWVNCILQYFTYLTISKSWGYY